MKESADNSPAGPLPWRRSGVEVVRRTQRWALVGRECQAGMEVLDEEAGRSDRSRRGGVVNQCYGAARGRMRAGTACVRVFGLVVVGGASIGAMGRGGLLRGVLQIGIVLQARVILTGSVSASTRWVRARVLRDAARHGIGMAMRRSLHGGRLPVVGHCPAMACRVEGRYCNERQCQCEPQRPQRQGARSTMS